MKRWVNYSPISLSFPLVDCLFSYSVQKLWFFVFSAQNFVMGLKRFFCKFLILFGFGSNSIKKSEEKMLCQNYGFTFGIRNILWNSLLFYFSLLQLLYFNLNWLLYRTLNVFIYNFFMSLSIYPHKIKLHYRDGHVWLFSFPWLIVCEWPIL